MLSELGGLLEPQWRKIGAELLAALQALRSWIRAEVNARDGYHGNALQAASDGGHEAVIRLLFDKGAEVNAQGGCHGNALQEASSGGHEAVVKMLVAWGAKSS
jgi:ankyrin repeat protein